MLENYQRKAIDHVEKKRHLRMRSADMKRRRDRVRFQKEWLDEQERLRRKPLTTAQDKYKAKLWEAQLAPYVLKAIRSETDDTSAALAEAKRVLSVHTERVGELVVQVSFLLCVCAV